MQNQLCHLRIMIFNSLTQLILYSLTLRKSNSIFIISKIKLNQDVIFRSNQN